MKKRALPVALALATALATAPGGAARADTSPPGLPPGGTLDETTWKQAEGLFPEEILARYRDGKFRSPVGKIVAPYQLDETFLAASEANEGKYRISPEGSLVEAATGKPPEYGFGLPFPKIDPNDPQAAEKILWNYEYAYWSNGSNKITSRLVWLNGTGKSPERSVVLQSLAMVYEGNRRKIDNPQQFSRLDRNLLLEPADANGTASLGWRYKDPAKRDQLWAYVPALRRVRATSPSNRSDGVFGSEMTQDDGFNGFDAKPEDFNWTFKGEVDGLRYVDAENLKGKFNAKWQDSGGWRFFWPEGKELGYDDPAWKGVAWAPIGSAVAKRKFYVVEGVPKDRYYLFGKLELWLDKESFQGAWNRKFDWKGELLNTMQVIAYNLNKATRPDGSEDYIQGSNLSFQCAENVKMNRATVAGRKWSPTSALDVMVDYNPKDFTVEALARAGK